VSRRTPAGTEKTSPARAPADKICAVATELGIPPAVRAKARQFGAGAWLDGLPDLIAGLERDWSITAGAPFADATEAYVAEATRADGGRAVLKLMVPRPGDQAAHEITVLRLARGAGLAELLDADESRGAMLLERLGPSLADLGVPFERRLRILTGLASSVWRPAPGCGLPTGADKGRWLAGFITRMWRELDRPCSEAAVEHALACAGRRIAGHDDERAVLVHGDVHQWNTLRAGDDPRSGFKLVDPDGLLADAEYDLGVLMREDPVELMAGDPWDRAHRLAAGTGRDATAIWEWGVVERVSTGLLLTSIGLQPVGTQMLEAADLISRLAA
jgi:streptomycin 6-kinase